MCKMCENIEGYIYSFSDNALIKVTWDTILTQGKLEGKNN